MQTRAESILRTINKKSSGLNVLTFPTHERFSQGMGHLPHTFYLYQAEGIKTWNNKYAQLPDNHILLDGGPGQVKPDMKFDVVLSQNKFGQYEIAKQISEYLNIPLISLEHTLPFPEWTKKHRQKLKEMRGDLDLFISEYSVKEWGFDLQDPKVDVIHHGIDTKLFKPFSSGGSTQERSEISNRRLSGAILTVVNDWINRDWCCGWNIYRRISDGLPVTPLGDTTNFSKPAENINKLVEAYQNTSVFLNTSIISPVPTALLEAMSCGCPVVTTATCMIPEIVQDGYNGFCSNDEAYLKDKLEWCLSNQQEAITTIGQNARKTIIERFSLEKHLEKWGQIFDTVCRKV
jgi:glycosyltransferase involved in cell wall biosynthesis